jgi:murein DD-endopeptidase MepM/ murein hydrolase activator NlpD
VGRAAAVATLAATALALSGVPAQAAGRANVAALQVALRGVGLYGGTIDGHAGPLTRRAVRSFQRRKGLAVDGVAGPGTRRALGRRGRPRYGSRIIRRGAAGWDVAALQFKLAWRGFPSGPIDGGFGSRSEGALRRYQRWAGLGADGAAGRGTFGALGRPRPASPLSFARPVRAPISDRFGPRGNRFHTGVDFTAGYGAAVRAARSGRVSRAGWDSGGYGYIVIISHGRGVTSWYAHLSRIRVGGGWRVGTGTRIGDVGSSGFATGPHLHFEVHVRGAAVPPPL